MLAYFSRFQLAYLTFKHLADTFILKKPLKEDPLLNHLSSQDIN